MFNLLDVFIHVIIKLGGKMSKTTLYDVVILGAGPAGLFAAYELIENNNEFIINKPTHLTVKVTTIAIIEVKIISINKVLYPLLFAKEEFKLVISILLNKKHHNITIIIKTINKRNSSSVEILNKSPTK